MSLLSEFVTSAAKLLEWMALTSVADINADGRGQTVPVTYDYRHRPVTLLTSAPVTVTRMG